MQRDAIDPPPETEKLLEQPKEIETEGAFKPLLHTD
jgi:hypothetical protein